MRIMAVDGDDFAHDEAATRRAVERVFGFSLLRARILGRSQIGKKGEQWCGATQTQLKKENGARFGCPEAVSVETQAIGRGTTELRMMLYISRWEGCEAFTFIERV